MLSRCPRTAARCLLVFSFAALPAGSSIAATHNWTGASFFSDNWNDTGNWFGLDAPNSNGTDVIVFGSGAPRLTPVVNVNHNVHQVIFRDDTFAAPSYTVGGSGRIQITGQGAQGDPGIFNQAAAAQIVNAPILLVTPEAFFANFSGDGRLTIGGTVNTNGNILRAQVNGNGMTFNGAITGAGDVAKNGVSVMTLNASSSYTGYTAIFDGVLRLGASNVLPDGTNVFLNGGNLDLADHTDTVASVTVYPGSDIVAQNDALALAGTATSFVLTFHNGGDLTDGDLFLQLLGDDQSIINTSEDTAPGAGVVSEIEPNLRLGSSTASFYVGRYNTSAGEPDVRWNGVISQSGGVRLTSDTGDNGPGILQLTAANTYTGGTSIMEGTLLVDNTSGSGTGTGDVIVTTNPISPGDKILGGNGSIAGAVTVMDTGTISPGTPGGDIGDLQVGSVNFEFSEFGSNLVIEFDDASPDQLIVDNTATLGGNLRVRFLVEEFMPAANEEFTILTAGSLVGEFDNVADQQRIGIFGSDGSFVVNYDTGSNSVILSDFDIIVQPNLPGDYNQNGTVDAADYVVWRKNEGSANPLPNDPIGGTIGPAQFDQWRANFGATAGSGAGVSANASVPEPETLAMLMFAAAARCLRRKRSHSKSQQLVDA